MSNNIKNIVVYNPAALAVKDVSIFYDDEKEIKKMIVMYETAGEKVIIKNGQSHSIDVFLNKDTQAKIVTELKKVKGYQDANNKS